ncbi:MAG: helix-turn-helix domain-containing protein [Pirellula sp.]
MSDAQSQRNVPKRQIARLIGSSSFPMWVLSEDSQLVFVNEAFEALFTQLGPEPLGLRCSLDTKESTSERTVLARWLAIPMNGSIDQVRCVRDRLPSSSDTEQKPLLRWVFPLDDSSEPCYLCILKPDAGDAQSIFERDFHERIEVPSLGIWESYPNLDGVWFLQGQSLRSQTLRNQLQLAVQADHPLRLVGQPGNYLIAIAGLVFKERRLRRGQAISKTPPFTIDCSLMDKDLLKSTFEWIDDTRRKGGATEVILHRLELLPDELQEALARTCRDQNWSFITTTGFDSQGLQSSLWDNWDWLIASSDVQRIEIAPLSERTEEIESLLFAWMRRSPGSRWSSSFLDALLAYAWPGDIDEFDRALEEALKAGAQGELEESHLPISLRTYPSHIERPGIEPPIDLDQVLERLERLLIERALASYPKNNTAAAKSLGISRARLLRRMKQWGLGDQRSTAKEQDEVIFEELDN